MQINKELPIKYTLNIYRLTPEYPTQVDVIFDIANHIKSLNKRKKKWTEADMKISASLIGDIFKNISSESKVKVKEILSKLNYENLITIEDGNLIICKSGLTLIYN